MNNMKRTIIFELAGHKFRATTHDKRDTQLIGDFITWARKNVKIVENKDETVEYLKNMFGMD